jgi:hypothetical protein
MIFFCMVDFNELYNVQVVIALCLHWIALYIIMLLLENSSNYSPLMQLKNWPWCRVSWECQGKFYIICFNPKAKEQHRKNKTCQNCIVYLFLNLIFSLFFIRFQQFKVLWVCQIKIYINNLSSKGKKQHRKAMKNMNVLNFKVWIKLVIEH